MTGEPGPEVHRVGQVAAWFDDTGELFIKAVDGGVGGDPVELNSNEARALAEVLIDLAAFADEH